ncbi:hypothetical protein M8C21_023676, partial [Ambrosia artemisiifolia]
MLLNLIFFLFTFPLTMVVGTFEGAKPDCPTHCGNITVPYPFGIGPECSLAEAYNLTCNNTSSYEPPNLLPVDGNLRIYDISDSELRISTLVSYMCYNQSGFVDGNITSVRTTEVFTFSEKNRFTVVGCDDYAYVTGTEEDDFASGCFGVCRKTHVPKGQCSGVGCCQISIPTGVSFYNAELYTLRNHSDVLSFNECGYGFLVEEGVYEFGGISDLSGDKLEFINRIQSTMPIVVDWVIAPNKTCATEVVNECKGNSSCYDVDGGGYRCKCNQGYEGNPYLDPGCQDIDECSNQGTYPCHGICSNTLGNYTCTCEPGSNGDPHTPNGCKDIAKDTIHVVLIIVVVSSILAVLSGIAGICFASHDRPTMKEVAIELDGLRKFTTHPWAQQQTCNETRSLVLEVEQSDLYDIPLINDTNEWESYSGITETALIKNHP